MKKKSPLGHLTPSICEAAFDEYSKHDDSLARMIFQNQIDVRHFIILSFVCDQEKLCTVQIAKILGIPRVATERSINHLIGANMIEYVDDDDSESHRALQLTPAGHLVVMRVHGRQD